MTEQKTDITRDNDTVRALNIFKKAGLDYVCSEYNSRGYVLKIENGSSILTYDQIMAKNFKGDEIQGRGKSLDKALVSLANAFILATSGGYVATFAPNGENYTTVRILQNSSSGIKTVASAVTTNDREQVMGGSFFPPPVPK
jgi:hypothetical protein